MHLGQQPGPFTLPDQPTTDKRPPDFLSYTPTQERKALVKKEVKLWPALTIITRSLKNL